MKIDWTQIVLALLWLIGIVLIVIFASWPVGLGVALATVASSMHYGE